jgi:predicted NBD/HSP70 family sugar kinase
MISLGVDIGGTSVKIAARENGKTLWTGQSSFYARPDTAALLKAIAQAADGRASNPDVIGLCVPGLLDKPRRMITLSVNVPGLMNVVLDDLIGDALKIRVSNLQILNDAVSSAYDVADQRQLKGRVFGLAIGTGVGAAVLDDGVPLFIEGASPGHIGQVDVSIEGHPVIGPDGGAGSLEGYVGVPAFKKRYRVNELGPVLEKMNAADVPMLALARAIRIAHAIYRPQHVLLVGGLGIRIKHVIPELKRVCDTNLSSVAREDWTLSAGESDFHACTGAAKIAERANSPR